MVPDFDEAVRRRAYEIWVREGRPSGREHAHWYEAALEIETETEAEAASEPLVIAQPWQSRLGGAREVERLRRALWEPQPYNP